MSDKSREQRSWYAVDEGDRNAPRWRDIVDLCEDVESLERLVDELRIVTNEAELDRISSKLMRNDMRAERDEVRAERDALAKRVEELEAEVKRARELIVRDRNGMASALNAIRAIAHGYRWIPEGELGCYTHAGCGEGVELTDAVLREEIGRCLDEIRSFAADALAASGERVNEMFAERRAGRAK